MELKPNWGTPKEKDMDIQKVYTYKRHMLFERLMRIFIYEKEGSDMNPFPFPTRELDYRLLKSGGAALVDDEKVGWMATWLNASGVTQYTDVFTQVTYAAPTAKGGTIPIGKKAIVFINDSTRTSLQPHVDMYASLMAHAYMSLKIALINTRAQDILAANNDDTIKSIKEWYKSLYDGEPLAILDDSLMNLNESILNLVSTNKGVSLSDLVTVEQDLMRAFFRDIGIRMVKDKKSNMVVDEVNNDEQMLLYNIDDMLYCRKQSIEQYNKITGENIVVKINPIFEIIKSFDVETEGGNHDTNSITVSQSAEQSTD